MSFNPAAHASGGIKSVVVLIAWHVGLSAPALSQSFDPYVAHGPVGVDAEAELDPEGPAEPVCGFLHAVRPMTAAIDTQSGNPARTNRRRKFPYFMMNRLPL